MASKIGSTIKTKRMEIDGWGSAEVRVTERAGWPAGYVIPRYGRKNAPWAAMILSEVDGYDPIVMRVSVDDFDHYDDEGPGEYLLLPTAQAEAVDEAIGDAVRTAGGAPEAVAERLRGLEEVV